MNNYPNQNQYTHRSPQQRQVPSPYDQPSAYQNYNPYPYGQNASSRTNPYARENYSNAYPREHSNGYRRQQAQSAYAPYEQRAPRRSNTSKFKKRAAKSRRKLKALIIAFLIADVVIAIGLALFVVFA